MKKRFIAMLLCFCMILSISQKLAVAAVSEQSAGEFAGGDGTSENPYLIETKEQLNNIRNHLSSHFKMITDIEFVDADFAEGGDFYNEGRGWESIDSFSGNLDGNNHSIFNLYINSVSEEPVSIGFVCSNSGTISNLSVVGNIYVEIISILGTFGTPKIGGIVAVNGKTALLNNCMFNGNITVNYKNSKSNYSCDIGGVAGWNKGTIISSINDSDINLVAEGNAVVGGICGRSVNSGIVGEYVAISRCENHGSISFYSETGTTNYSGGICGINGEKAIVENCLNNGKISLETSTRTSAPDIYASGIIGQNQGVISQCYNTAEIIAHNPSWNSASVGGVAAENSGTIINCFNQGFLIGDNDIGGITSNNKGGTITGSYNIASIKATEYGYAAGITPYNSGTITDCFNTGNIFIESLMVGGGIVGENTGIVSTCYNIGSVNYNNNESGTIVGGIVGINQGKASSCYYIDNISDGCGSGEDMLTQCNINELTMRETFAGFDFEEVWCIGVSTLFEYPELRNARVKELLADISSCTVTLDSTTVQYNSFYAPTVTVVYNGVTLEYNKDYIVQYTIGDSAWCENNRQLNMVGAATINVIGVGKFSGLTTLNFEITKFDMSNASVMERNGMSSWPFVMKDFECDGTEKVQSGFVIYDNFDIIDTSCYTVTYRNNIEIGTATMIITGIGDYYTGVLEKEFHIYPRAIQAIEVSKLPNKLVYKKGESQVDVAGGEITIYYQDGGIETIAMTADMLDGDYNLDIAATHNVGLTYKESTTYFEITVIDITCGDANGDGKITAADARIALRISAKVDSLEKYNLTAEVLDVTGDGKLTAADARKILRIAAKIE